MSADRAQGRRLAALLFAALLFAAAALSIAGAARAADAPPAPAQPDSTAPPSPAPRTEVYRDTTLVVREGSAPGDTSSTPAAAANAAQPLSAVDFEEQRKRGDVSLERATRGRRGSLLLELPTFGSATGSLSVPDTGSRIRSEPMGYVADVATDATLFSATQYGIGVFDLGVAVDNPRADAVETLDLTDLKSDLAPGPFLDAGSLLARPEADRSFTRVMPGEGKRAKRSKSALYFGSGEGGVLDTGARFVSPEILKGVAGSYARHEADGGFPLRRGVSSRYALAAGLPRALGHTLWIEGSLFTWDLEDEAYGIDPPTGDLTVASSRAEISSRDLTLHARSGGESWESRWTVRGGNAKRTRVDVNGGRERWEFPGASAAWDGHLDLNRKWTARASVDASSRRIVYRVDESPLFQPRREEVKAAAGLKRALSPGAGVALDATANWRETESAFVGGRASIWGEGGRARGRLDLEWANERPSWVDLMSPDRVLVAPNLIQFTPSLRLERSGDPTLDPRILAGGLARGSYEVSRTLVLEGEGSVRRLHDDFGWDLYVRDTVDTLFVDTRAERRGDGWRSYGALGVRFQPGLLKLRALAWGTGGMDVVGPRSSSPPQYGGELSADIRVTFFKGDLPIELGYDLHVQGPREGLIHEPGAATSDLSARADFGPAGAFLEFENMSDRKVASAVYDVSFGQPTMMPERAFHFGIVWYLFD